MVFDWLLHHQLWCSPARPNRSISELVQEGSSSIHTIPIYRKGWFHMRQLDFDSAQIDGTDEFRLAKGDHGSLFSNVWSDATCISNFGEVSVRRCKNNLATGSSLLSCLFPLPFAHDDIMFLWENAEKIIHLISSAKKSAVSNGRFQSLYSIDGWLHLRHSFPQWYSQNLYHQGCGDTLQW